MNDTTSPLPPPLTTYIANVMPSMDGWCTPVKAEALARVVLAEKPLHLLEIGVFGGHSLVMLALACHAVDRGHVYGVDPWDAAASIDGWSDDNRTYWSSIDHNAVLDKCRRYIREMGVEPRVTLLRATAEMIVPFFDIPRCILGAPWLDLLHIDGNHSEAHALHDVRAFVPLVRSGGIVIFDDTNWATTAAAQELLRQSCDELYTVGDNGQLCGFFRKR